MYYTSTSRYGLADTTIHKVCVTLRTNVSFPIDGLIPFDHSYPVRVRSSQMHRGGSYIFTARELGRLLRKVCPHAIT